MAYVPGARYDLFISYASADNATALEAGSGWIVDFTQDLEIALRQRLGGTDALAFYFDQRALGANQSLDALLAAARDSACFLSICSRSYVQREWTNRELEQFRENEPEGNRLFVAEILPLEADEIYPPMLAERHRLQFYRRSPISKVAVPINRTDPEYGLLIHDLAEQIRVQLMAMRTVSDAQKAVDDFEVELTGRKTVLLAQVTEDLDAQREDLRRFLEQFGHRVIPPQPFRQGGMGFREDVADALVQADLFVQLLGPIKGRCPPDLADGYARTQLGLAQDAGVKALQWRASTLDPATIDDPEHRDLLGGETVMASGFETFKSTVRKRLEREEPMPAQTPGDQTLQTVFVNADEADLDYARHVRDEFARNGFMAATPTGEPTPELLKEHLLDCDALVLLYGHASPVWTDRSLRFFNKLRAKREKPPKIVAVLLGPPPEKLGDLGINMPGLKVFGQPTEWTDTSVEEVIEALKA